MNSNTAERAAQRNSVRHDRRRAAASTTRFTTIWGWFTAPRFGSAGSGGLEYERLTSKDNA